MGSKVGESIYIRTNVQKEERVEGIKKFFSDQMDSMKEKAFTLSVDLPALREIMQDDGKLMLNMLEQVNAEKY